MSQERVTRADSNRRRILDVALTELLRDPDASMDQIARAAGVVRRTVYGHFPSRETLIVAIAEGAIRAIGEALESEPVTDGDPAGSLARRTLAVWQVADRYRLLVSLAQRSGTMEDIRGGLAPHREELTQLFRLGLDAGAFTSVLTAGALALVQEQVLFGLMQAVNDGELDAKEAGTAAAITSLITAGVPASEATALVAGLSA